MEQQPPLFLEIFGELAPLFRPTVIVEREGRVSHMTCTLNSPPVDNDHPTSGLLLLYLSFNVQPP